MNKRQLILLGVVAMVAAVAAFVAAFVAGTSRFTSDVEDEAIEVVEAPNTADLDAGTSQWWVRLDIDEPDQERIDEFMREVELRVEDADGNVAPSRSADWQGSYGSFGDFSPYAFVDIPESGEYAVESDRARTFYLTEPLEADGTTATFATAITLALILGTAGTILLIVGFTRRPTA